jgi:Rod binding domain-containing protein
MSLAGLPPIDQSLLPPDVRNGSPAERDAYRSALGFEQLLVQQLTTSVADTTKDAMGGDSPYASMLPDALADSIMNGGGLGLAPQLAKSLESSS